jgi:hypothetical protein
MPDNEKQSEEWKQTVVPNVTTAASTPSVNSVSVIMESKWAKAGVVIAVVGVAVTIILFLLQH